MSFQRLSERVQGKSRPPESRWKVIPQSRTSGRETPITEFVMCSWHKQLPHVIGIGPQWATANVRQKATVVCEVLFPGRRQTPSQILDQPLFVVTRQRIEMFAICGRVRSSTHSCERKDARSISVLRHDRQICAVYYRSIALCVARISVAVER